MTKATLKTIAGQPSYVLRTAEVEADVTRLGGMVGPVTFCRGANPIQPYSVAPWAGEQVARDTPPIIVALRGDFMCSSFGGNAAPHKGKALGVHGDTANGAWKLESFEQSKAGQTLRMSLAMRALGGRCVKTVALVAGHNVVYQRHDFSGVDGPINPGHHAMLRLPDRPGCGQLSFSRHVYAHTFVEPTENPAAKGYSLLKPDARIKDLRAVPCIDGSTSDVTRYPARRGYEDILIVCADAARELAWSACVVADEGYAWFTLRDPKLLPSTLLWFSNCGRYYAPWNGRHVNVVGVEDMTGFFHVGLAASARRNMLNDKGIVTCHRLKPVQTLSVPYIQGVARVPRRFDRVAEIVVESDDRICLIAESGVKQTVACCASFAKSGELA